MKLSAGKEIRWIGLRQPVAVENFAFESARPSVKAEVDLKWLPDPQAMRIELDPFEVEDPNGDDQKGKVFFEPREVLKKVPAAIFFREKAELKFFFVEVGVELRKKFRMQAQMFAVGTDGTPRALRKPSDLTQLADILAARKAEAEQYQARILQAGKKAEVLKMFPELKDAGDFRKIKSSVKKATDLASQQHAACGDYMKIMENLSGCRIPFQIFFEIDGQRIKLAQSTAAPFSSQPPK